MLAIEDPDKMLQAMEAELGQPSRIKHSASFRPLRGEVLKAAIHTVVEEPPPVAKKSRSPRRTRITANTTNNTRSNTMAVKTTTTKTASTTTRGRKRSTKSADSTGAVYRVVKIPTGSGGVRLEHVSGNTPFSADIYPSQEFVLGKLGVESIDDVSVGDEVTLTVS